MLNIGTVRRIRLAATDSFPPQPLGSKTINALLSGCGELAICLRVFANKVTIYHNPT